jgi:putative DNA primase/helicase
VARTQKDKLDFTVVDGAKGWRSPTLAISASGALKECFQNVAEFLRNCPPWRDVLAIDEFSREIVCVKDSPLGQKPGDLWKERDDLRLGEWLSSVQGLTVKSVEQIRLGVVLAAGERPFHPVRDYLEGLQWDQEKRLDTWAAQYLGARANEYTGLVGRYFLLNMIRRIFEPGCIMRSVPVLEGAQNRGKSRALYTLAQPWFADTPFRVGDKDAYISIQGVWLYEIAELESFSKAEATAVKAFVSSTKDRFRTPYGRAVTDQQRQTIFAATTNATEYLRDWTGATRFWPLMVGLAGDLDLAGLAAIRDQLFAEAVHYYRAGGDEARAYPTRELEDRLFAPEQERRLMPHPWLDVISDWLEENKQLESVTVRQILESAIRMEAREMGRDQQAGTRVGQIMAKLGWTKDRDSKPPRHWRWNRPKPAPSKPAINPKDLPDDIPF